MHGRLLLSELQVLILDEPGNHFDVDTVEGWPSLEDTLITVLSSLPATTGISWNAWPPHSEVRDSRVTNYSGDYIEYLYRVTKEVAEGVRGRAGQTVALHRGVTDEAAEQSKAERKARNRRRFELRTKLQSVERQMEKYAEKKKALEAQLQLAETPHTATRLRGRIYIAVKEKLLNMRRVGWRCNNSRNGKTRKRRAYNVGTMPAIA